MSSYLRLEMCPACFEYGVLCPKCRAPFAESQRRHAEAIEKACQALETDIAELRRKLALPAEPDAECPHEDAPEGVCNDCGENVCDHSDMEDGYCLICGADRTEDLAAAAYDRAKGGRYE